MPPRDAARRREEILTEQRRRDDLRSALRVMFGCGGDSLEDMQKKGLDPVKVIRAVDVATIACGPLIARAVYTWTLGEWQDKERTNPWTGEPLDAQQEPLIGTGTDRPAAEQASPSTPDAVYL